LVYPWTIFSKGKFFIILYISANITNELYYKQFFNYLPKAKIQFIEILVQDIYGILVCSKDDLKSCLDCYHFYY
jgi:hypothetical protein